MAIHLDPEETPAKAGPKSDENASPTMAQPGTPPPSSTAVDESGSLLSRMPHPTALPVQSPLPQRLFESSPQQATGTASVSLEEVSTLHLDETIDQDQPPNKHTLYKAFIAEVSPITAPDEGQQRSAQYRCVAPAAVTRTFEIGPKRPAVIRHIQPGEIVEMVDLKRGGRSIRGRLRDGGWVSLKAGDGTVLLERLGAQQVGEEVSSSKRISSARSPAVSRSPRRPRPKANVDQVSVRRSTRQLENSRSPQRPKPDRNADSSEASVRRNSTHLDAGMSKETADRLLGRSNSPSRHRRAQSRVADAPTVSMSRVTIFDKRPIGESPVRREVQPRPKPASPTRYRAPNFKETMSRQTKQRLMGNSGDRSISTRAGEEDTSQTTSGYRSTIFASRPQTEPAAFRKPHQHKERPSWTSNTRSVSEIYRVTGDRSPTIWQKQFAQQYQAKSQGTGVSVSERLHNLHADMLDKREQMQKEEKLRRLDEERAEIEQSKDKLLSARRVSTQREPSDLLVHQRLYEQGRAMLDQRDSLLMTKRKSAEAKKSAEELEELTFHPKITKLARRLQAHDMKTPEERLNHLSDPSRPRSNSRSRSSSPAPMRTSINDPRIGPGPAAVLGTSGQSSRGYRCTLFTQAIGEKHLQNQPPRFRQDVRTLVSKAAMPLGTQANNVPRLRSESPFKGRASLDVDVLHALSQDELNKFMDAETAADEQDWDAAIGLYDEGIAQARKNDKTESLKAVLQPYVERVGFFRQQRRSSRQRKASIAAVTSEAPADHSLGLQETPRAQGSQSSMSEPSQTVLNDVEHARKPCLESTVALVPPATPATPESNPKTSIASPNAQLDLGGGNKLTGLRALQQKIQNAETHLTSLRDDVHSVSPSPQRAPRRVENSTPSSPRDAGASELMWQKKLNELEGDATNDTAELVEEAADNKSQRRSNSSSSTVSSKDTSTMHDTTVSGSATTILKRDSANLACEDDQDRGLSAAQVTAHVDEQHDDQTSPAVQSEVQKITIEDSASKRSRTRRASVEQILGTAENAKHVELNEALASDPVFGELAGLVANPNTMAEDPFAELAGLVSNPTSELVSDVTESKVNNQRPGQAPDRSAQLVVAGTETQRRSHSDQARAHLTKQHDIADAETKVAQNDAATVLVNARPEAVAEKSDKPGLEAPINSVVAQEPIPVPTSTSVPAGMPDQKPDTTVQESEATIILQPDAIVCTTEADQRSAHSAALRVAGVNGDLAGMMAAMDAGGDVETVGADGLTVLYNAAAAGDIDVVDVLLTSGANPEAGCPHTQFRPLHAAAQRGHAGVVRRLLAAGVDTNAKNMRGKTAREVALQKKRDDVVAIIDAANGSMQDLMHQLAQGWEGSRHRAAKQPRSDPAGTGTRGDDGMLFTEPNGTSEQQQESISENRLDEKFIAEQKALGLLSSSDEEGVAGQSTSQPGVFEGADGTPSVVATDTDEAATEDDTDEDADNGSPHTNAKARRAGSLGNVTSGPPPMTRHTPPVASAPAIVMGQSFETITSADPFAAIEAMTLGGANATSGSSQLPYGDDPYAEIAAMTSATNSHSADPGDDPFAELQALVS